MRLEKKRRQEQEERKGLTGRTIIQGIWLIISAGVAFALIYMIGLDEVAAFGYNRLLIPRRFIDPWMIWVAAVLIIVTIMQFIFMLGFFLVSPLGRKRPGHASIYSRRVDPLDSEYHR